MPLEHAAPPPCASLMIRVRVQVPDPHETEQPPQSDHAVTSQSTGAALVAAAVGAAVALGAAVVPAESVAPLQPTPSCLHTSAMEKISWGPMLPAKAPSSAHGHALQWASHSLLPEVPAQSKRSFSKHALGAGCSASTVVSHSHVGSPPAEATAVKRAIASVRMLRGTSRAQLYEYLGTLPKVKTLESALRPGTGLQMR